MIQHLLTIAAFLLILLYAFWRCWFCRRPRRRIPGGRTVVSPANGTVAVIKRFHKGLVRAAKWNGAALELDCSDVARSGWFVLIVMTPLNVHCQRAPIEGRILSTRYVKGSFHNAVNSPGRLLTLQNERNEILIEGALGKVKVVQIAGFLARRIRCAVTKNQKVEKGEELGFIDLGSQVALILPASVELVVKEGATVLDGESVIGRYA